MGLLKPPLGFIDKFIINFQKIKKQIFWLFTFNPPLPTQAILEAPPLLGLKRAFRRILTLKGGGQFEKKVMKINLFKASIFHVLFTNE